MSKSNPVWLTAGLATYSIPPQQHRFRLRGVFRGCLYEVWELCSLFGFFGYGVEDDGVEVGVIDGSFVTIQTLRSGRSVRYRMYCVATKWDDGVKMLFTREVPRV